MQSLTFSMTDPGMAVQAAHSLVIGLKPGESRFIGLVWSLIACQLRRLRELTRRPEGRFATQLTNFAISGCDKSCSTVLYSLASCRSLKTV